MLGLYSIEPEQAIIFEVAGFFVAAFFSRLHVFFLSRRQKRTAAQEMQDLYRRTWKGYDDDRLYAWYRVRLHLNTFDPDPEKLRFVERQLASSSEKPMLSPSSINEKGELEHFTAPDRSVT